MRNIATRRKSANVIGRHEEVTANGILRFPSHIRNVSMRIHVLHDIA
jgi:hypothetical protein